MILAATLFHVDKESLERVSARSGALYSAPVLGLMKSLMRGKHLAIDGGTFFLARALVPTLKLSVSHQVLSPTSYPHFGISQKNTKQEYIKCK